MLANVKQPAQGEESNKMWFVVMVNSSGVNIPSMVDLFSTCLWWLQSWEKMSTSSGMSQLQHFTVGERCHGRFTLETGEGRHSGSHPLPKVILGFSQWSD